MIEKNKIYLGDSYKLIKQIPDKKIINFRYLNKVIIYHILSLRQNV